VRWFDVRQLFQVLKYLTVGKPSPNIFKKREPIELMQ
jgi:hypothetical protein